MGQVFRATDTRLKRQVAIKILPPSVAADYDRLARFQREAEVLASLNHPNIGGIHGLEESGGVTALVLELVEGPTLADRIAQGAIPIDEALPIAKQIAEALEAAHEQGVIHRDLKPANIKVRPDGTVKVLDFGLAKAMEPIGAVSSSPSVSPTITTPAMTHAGMILGTPAYMSPEQARGKPVDKRSDIWAFACVLYEMLTGTRAFPGDDVTDTTVSVLSKEPDWSALPSLTPAFVRVLLRRGMDKNPKRRLRDIGDARLVLEGAFEGVGAEMVGTATAPGGRLAWMAFAVALLAATALAVPAVLYFRAGPVDAPETRLDIVTPETTDPLSFALSPDGRQLVFAASGDGQQRLWLRPLDKTTAQPLAGTEGASVPFWSPNGRSLGFYASGQLKRIDLAGGSAQPLATVQNARGGTWGPDDTILFAPTITGPLFRIPAMGGRAVAVTTLEKHLGHRFPQFLPGGRQFLFHALGTPGTGGIYLGSLDGPEITRLTAADAAGVYAPGGMLLFVQAGTLLAQRLDLEQRALVGNPVTVADPVGVDGFTGAVALSVSSTGLVAYRAGVASRRQLTWFDRSGKPLGVVGAPDENNLLAPRVSPDGRRVAAHRTVQGNVDIFLLDADRTTRFTFDAALDRFPVWSPDGGRIVFDSNRRGSRDLYQASSARAGSEKLLLESAQNASDWSTDGRFISYLRLDSQTAWDIWMLPLEGDRKPLVFLNSAYDERRADFSPNGRWVAYHSNASGSGSYEVYVRSFPGPGDEVLVSTMGGLYPRWGPEGTELYYLAPDGTLMAAPIAVSGATLEPGRPVPLFHTRIVGGGADVNLGMNYDVARDGRFLINTILEGTAATPITLLLNWRPDATP